MNSITLSAPAKINLYLKVLRKRPDGYHDILTVFERISLCDRIRITKIPEGIVVRSDVPITEDPRDDIAYKAARLMLDRGRVRGGARIEIRKRIPIAAGLGGGSSDAAAVLIGLKRLYNINITRSTLMALGGRLGSDVPFFLSGSAFAIGSGTGVKLRKAETALRIWHLLVYPGPFKASTAGIYSSYDRLPKCLTRDGRNAKISMPRDWKGLESLLHNDLGDVVAKRRPEVRKTIQCLAASLGRKMNVSGSGPSLFCLYRTRREAERAKERLCHSVPASMRRGWRVFVVGTI